MSDRFPQSTSGSLSLPYALSTANSLATRARSCFQGSDLSTSKGRFSCLQQATPCVSLEAQSYFWLSGGLL